MTIITEPNPVQHDRLVSIINDITLGMNCHVRLGYTDGRGFER